MSQWWFRAILSGGMVFALGCAAQSTNLNTAASTDSPIRLHVETPSDGVRLVIEGDNPLIYTAFRLPDPPRLVLDLAGVAMASNQQTIQVDHGAVTTIHPAAGTVAGAAGGRSVRIEVGLTQLVDYQLRPDGSKLLVTIANPGSQADASKAAEAAPAHDAAPSATSAADVIPQVSSQPQAAHTDTAQSTEPAPPAPRPAVTPDQPAMPVVKSLTADAAPPAPSAPVMPESDATAVTAVHVNPGGSAGSDVVVTIEGNGRFHPETMLMSGPRLVLDLPGTTARLRPRLAVNEPLLKQVRIGVHKDPQKVRIVFDLVQPVRYDVTQDAGTLKVTFTTSAATAAPASAQHHDESSMAPQSSAKEPQVRMPAASEPVPSPKTVRPEKTVPSVAKTPQAASPASDGDMALPLPTVPKKTVQAQLASNAGAGSSPIGPVVGQKQYSGRLISLDFQDADLDNVLRLMADVSGLNIVVGEGVKGKVTVKLLNVPWDQALDLILRTHGLGQVREGNILRIDTLGNLSKMQDDEAKAKDSAVKAEDLITRVVYVNYAGAVKLADPMRKHLSPRGDITVDERTNAMIVKDVSKSVQEVVSLLKVLDTKTPQVLIEARIVSADTNFARDLGVQWGGSVSGTKGPIQLGALTGPTGPVYTGSAGTPTPGFLVNLPAAGQAGSLGNLGFTLGKLTGTPFALDLRLSAGENQGVSKTISAPKVLVLDNQKAKIQQGTSIPYQSGATSASGPTTTFVEASLTLEVTPHVTPDGSILMDLHVANDEPDYANTVPGVGPPIKKKEAKTNIMVKDGETVVLGGIYISTNSESMSGLPWLNKIPFLGWLFKQTSKADTNNELLVFLVPKIAT